MMTRRRTGFIDGRVSLGSRESGFPRSTPRGSQVNHDTSPTRAELLDLLRWHVDAGVDEAVGDVPTDHFKAEPDPAPARREAAADRTHAPSGPAPAAPPPEPPKRGANVPLSLESPAAAEGSASLLANEASTLAELRDAMARFEGCSLKHTAMNLVFGDGNPDADVMFVGEAPGADEDREGLPFVGVSGRLLDRMIAAIGLDRTSAYITNILPWRPPGNRKPTTNEVTVCLPFIRRHIALATPRVLVLVGGTSASALLGRTEGITRLRGRWLIYRGDDAGGGVEVPCMAIYHPAYLLRQAALKRDAWRDLLAIQERLRSLE